MRLLEYGFSLCGICYYICAVVFIRLFDSTTLLRRRDSFIPHHFHSHGRGLCLPLSARIICCNLWRWYQYSPVQRAGKRSRRRSWKLVPFTFIGACQAACSCFTICRLHCCSPECLRALVAVCIFVFSHRDLGSGPCACHTGRKRRKKRS